MTAHMDEANSRTTRYLAFGDLEKVRERFAMGELTLTDLADWAKVSKETVRNDLKKLYGEDWYKAAIRGRQEMNRLQKPPFGGRDLSAEEAIKALTSDGCPCSDAEAKAGVAAINALVATRKVTAFRMGARGVSGAKTTKGWAAVRLFVADPSLKEFRMGLYRMRPTKGKSEAGLAIYGIMFEGQIIIYVLAEREIKDIASLNLRFDHISRKSKYSYARDRWEIL